MLSNVINDPHNRLHIVINLDLANRQLHKPIAEVLIGLYHKIVKLLKFQVNKRALFFLMLRRFKHTEELIGFDSTKIASSKGVGIVGKVMELQVAKGSL